MATPDRIPTGEEIRRARLAAGLNKMELARKLDVYSKTILNWERGGPISDEKIAGLVAWMESRGWRAPGDTRDAPPKAVRERAPDDYAPERMASPDAVITALDARIREVNLLMAYATERIGKLLQSTREYGVTLPGDVVSSTQRPDRAPDRTATGGRP